MAAPGRYGIRAKLKAASAGTTLPVIRLALSDGSSKVLLAQRRLLSTNDQVATGFLK